jgi:hypothetical protein
MEHADDLDLVLKALFDIRADVRRIREELTDDEEDDEAENS